MVANWKSLVLAYFVLVAALWLDLRVSTNGGVRAPDTQLALQDDAGCTSHRLGGCKLDVRSLYPTADLAVAGAFF
jgi:hypothetical protein